MSVLGTFRTCRDVRLESAIGDKADYMCSERVFRLLTTTDISANAPVGYFLVH
jgi:hypothetical protein